MRVDSDPKGRMMEDLLALAYMAHPYGSPTIGWTTDIVTTTRRDMDRFYEQHYIPSNITIAVAGDVKTRTDEEIGRDLFRTDGTRQGGNGDPYRRHGPAAPVISM